MENKITVWSESHYNRFLRIWDLRLTCDDSRWPIQVFADDIKEAKEFCQAFLGSDAWELKSAR